MLMRHQMTAANTEADFGLPVVVAPSSLTRVVVINSLDLILVWRSSEQRERE
jgi:hypothetical protein